MRKVLWLLLLFLFAQFAVPVLSARQKQAGITTVNAADLPKEAQQTIALIRKGGPYPYKKDGVVFGNFEKLLPLHERGYYKEFTVRTPGSRNRGAQRIISGKAGELYYTDNHYQSFKRVRE
jgi:ribonuclease T1